MNSLRRNRLVYGSLIISVVLMGLASRRYSGDTAFIRMYIGDVLWSLMVFFGFAFIVRQASTKFLAFAALLFSFAIEISQLYHAPWIDSLRATGLGGLVLGFTFVWSDLVCYSVGIMIGAFTETYLIPERFKRLSEAIS